MRNRYFFVLCKTLLICGALGILRQDTAQTIATAAEPAASPAGKLDASFVHPGFAAAVVVHPQRLLNSPLAAAIPKEELDERLQYLHKESHIDLRQVDQIMFLIGPPTPDGDANIPMTPGIVLRFREPPDQQAVVDGIFKKAAPAEFGGKKYFRNETPPGAVYFADARTYIIAPEKSLQKMIAAGKGSGPLADLMRETSADHDLVAVATMAPVKEVAKAAAERAKEDLPPPLRILTGLPDDLKSALATVDLNAEYLVKLSMQGNDEDGANMLQSYAIVTRDFVKTAIAAGKSKIKGSGPPAVVTPLLKLVDDVLAGISIKQDGLQVVLAVKTPAGWQELPKTLVPMIANARRAAQTARNGVKLKNVAAAILTRNESGQPLKAATTTKDGKALLSWRVEILPYIEQNALYEQFHHDEPWDSEHNRKLIEKMPPYFGDSTEGKTSFFVFTGEGTVFGAGKFPTANGDKQILLVAAGADKAVPWTKPQDLALDNANPAAALGTLPEGRFPAVFCDGSPRMLNAKMDPAALRQMIAPGGNAPEGKKTP